MGGIMSINLRSNKEEIVSFEGGKHDIFYSVRCGDIDFGLLTLCF